MNQNGQLISYWVEGKTLRGNIHIGGGDNERARVALNQPLFTQEGDNAIKPIRSITILVVPDYLGVYIAIYAT